MKKLFLVCAVLTGLATVSFAQSKLPTTPAEKAKGLQQQINLTDQQTEKVAAIYQESVQKFDKIKTKEHGNTDKMMTDVKPLRAETIKKITALLTPAQAVKYNKLLKESKTTSLNGGWSDGWSSAN
ncbi:MAG TPA: hypothetical protein VIM55_09400 [Mucilaginibacter sp.]